MNVSIFVKNIFVYEPDDKFSGSLTPVIVEGEDEEHHYLSLKLDKDQAKELLKELMRIGVDKW